jgi:hypothetical protein
MPWEDMKIISAAFAGPVISEGFGKLRALSNAYKMVEREAIILAELVDILPSGDYQRLID